jgi:predicted metal-dependent phosphoesterase TrpH
VADRIDLHIHTNCSDGLVSPAEVLRIVCSQNLVAFAICDHDSLEAHRQLKPVLGDHHPESVTGIELSAGSQGEDIHILGYLFDPDSPPLEAALMRFREKRDERALKMLKKLSELGIEVPMGLVRKIAGSAAIGRPHVADALLQVEAIAKYGEAFQRYIGTDGPAYIPKDNLSPEEAIKLIHKAGGLAFLAHPGISNIIRYLDELISYGLDGIEVYHPRHTPELTRQLRGLATEKSLLISGGSDFHGREDGNDFIGMLPVPREALTSMKEKWEEKRKDQV